jgi:hypothetical protein
MNAEKAFCLDTKVTNPPAAGRRIKANESWLKMKAFGCASLQLAGRVEPFRYATLRHSARPNGWPGGLDHLQQSFFHESLLFF